MPPNDRPSPLSLYRLLIVGHRGRLGYGGRWNHDGWRRQPRPATPPPPSVTQRQPAEAFSTRSLGAPGPAMEGNAAVAALLLDARADPHAQDVDRRTALLYAARNGHHEVVSTLLAREVPTPGSWWSGNSRPSGVQHNNVTTCCRGMDLSPMRAHFLMLLCVFVQRSLAGH